MGGSTRHRIGHRAYSPPVAAGIVTPQPQLLFQRLQIASADRHRIAGRHDHLRCAALFEADLTHLLQLTKYCRWQRTSGVRLSSVRSVSSVKHSMPSLRTTKTPLSLNGSPALRQTAADRCGCGRCRECISGNRRSSSAATSCGALRCRRRCSVLLSRFGSAGFSR